MYFGNPCHSSVLSTLVRAAFPATTPTLDLKPLLPFALDSAPAVGFLPAFSTAVVRLSGTEPGSALRSWKAGLASRRMCMDPVQKAIMGQTLGLLPAPAKSKHLVSCTLCQLNFNSENQALAHFKGTRHTRKLRVLEAPDARRKAADAVAKETARKDPPESISPNGLLPSTHATDCEAGAVSPPSTGAELSDGSGSAQVETAPDPTPGANPSAPGVTEAEVGEETEEEKAKRLLYCSLCKVAVNSASQLEAHNSGTKHKTMLEARSGAGAIKSFPRQGVKGRLASPTTSATGLQNKTFFCEICDVHVNSETQLKQHISSRRHKDRAAGKPAKPKYSPYSKTARTPSALPVHLAKPLPAGLIPGHVTAAGVPPISISSAPALAAALFQTQNLLRPAPGPLRTAHSPVLFSPY
ncbi:zinc finger protein 385D-like [Anguilla rostrata]|uniref:zinc finger protein 385D-like n=1 Tax=Anguilla rostrata TaxID=7938 RepID=UPI0030CCE7EE